MSFPNKVNVQPGVGVAGDFASANNRVSVVNGPGAFVAGASGVAVGLFAWADTNFRTVGNVGTGAPTGFLGRTQQALITTFLGETSMVVPAGLPVTLFSTGDFWVKNVGSGGVTIGMSAYVDNSSGNVQFAAAGGTITGFTQTKWIALSAGATLELIKMSSFLLG